MFRCGPVHTANQVCLNLTSRNAVYSYPFDYELQTGVDFRSEGHFLILDSIGVDQPPPCIQPIRYFSCLITAPPCDRESDLPLRICPESCLAFDTLMATSTCTDFNRNHLTQFKNTATFVNLLNMYFNFSCNDTSTYSISGQNGFDNNSCTHIFSDDVRSEYVPYHSMCGDQCGVSV